MRSRPIVATGLAGSGKTELSNRMARMLQYTSINIGDVLLRYLGPGVGDVRREDIGRRFFAQASLRDYLVLLDGCVGPSVVLDGVRIFEGLTHLRKSWDLIHVHRRPRPGIHDDQTPFAESADITIEWAEPIELLDEEIRKGVVARL